MPVLFWVLFTGVTAAGILFLLQWRAVRSQADALQTEHDRLSHGLETSRAEAKKLGGVRKKQAEELADLRKRIDKLKKRSAKGHAEEQERPRVAQLEESLRARDAELASLRASLESARESDGADRESEAADRVRVQAEALEAARQRAAKAEARAEAAEQKLREAADRNARQHKRLETQDQLYASVRGELAAKKERLRTQQEEIERLRALRVVLGAENAETPDDSEPPSAAASPPSETA